MNSLSLTKQKDAPVMVLTETLALPKFPLWDIRKSRLILKTLQCFDGGSIVPMHGQDHPFKHQDQ